MTNSQTSTMHSTHTGEKANAGAMTPTPSHKSSSPSSVKETEQDETEYPTGFKFAMVMVGVCFTTFLVALDQTIVATATPVITNQFNSFSDVGWYASAYLLTSTAMQPLAGRLYASFNIKTIFLLSIAIFEIGSLICAVAVDSPMFIVGRAIAGVGVAGGYSGSLIIITVSAPLHIRPLLTSLVGTIYGVGAVIGPLIGGALTSHATWRWCFYLNLCFIPLLVPTVFFFLSTPKRTTEKTVLQRLVAIDWLGTVLALGSIICILLVFQDGGIKYAWSDSRIIGLIVGFFVIGAAFWVVQWYMGEQATIPLRILRQRTILGGSIANFLIASAYFSELYFLPIYFQAIKGSSAIRSGVQTLPFIVAVIFALSLAGGLVNKFGYYIPYLFMGTALISIGAGALYTLGVDADQAMWAGLQFLAGFGPGMGFMLPFLAASAALDPKDIEVGSAIVIFFQIMGGTITVSLAQSVFQNKFVKYLREIPNGPDPASIVAKGVTAFRETVPAEFLPSIVSAANRALNRIWIIVAVFGAIAFFSIFIMELNRKVDVEASKQGEQAKKQSRQEHRVGDVEEAKTSS